MGRLEASQRFKASMDAVEALDEWLVWAVAHKSGHPPLNDQVARIRGPHLTGVARREPDMHFLKIEQAENVFDGGGAGEVAEAAPVLDQPLSAETGQGFADGTRAQVQGCGDVPDGKVLPRRETLAQCVSQT